MPTERLSMRDVREILRQKWQLGRSHRQVAESVGASAGAVGETMRRAKVAGVTSWATVEGLAPSELEARLYPSVAAAEKPTPDCAWIHRERRRVGVTLQLLHLEYVEQQPDGYRYSQFCEHYRRWLRQRGATMRQVHQAGEKTFVDYSGKKPCIWDEKTGERIEVELFVAVLGASNFTYAEATRTQRGPDWIGSHTRAFAYFGGVTAATVCDQLKPGVTLSCRYEPGIQRTYEEMAAHYGTTVLPARPWHPRDKPKVEGAVLIVQRWILARLRNETHFSLGSLNARIAELLEDLNDRRMRVYQVSRRQLFDKLERSVLKPLPTTRFVYGEWSRAKVNVDYHVESDGHYYSVPHAHLHAHVDVRVSAGTVEILLDGRRVASHVRSFQRGRHTTTTEHMPAAHRAHLEWSPSRIINWAGTIGPSAAALVEHILHSRENPESAYRTCMALIRSAKPYEPARFDAACRRAIEIGSRTRKSVLAILSRGLHAAPLPETTEPAPGVPHENVRGGAYYDRKENQTP